MRYLLLPLFVLPLFVLPLLSIAQISHSFEIKGTTEYYNNQQITVAPAIFDSSYLDPDLFHIEHADSHGIAQIQVSKSRFEISGKVSYPVPVQFSCLEKGETGNRVFASDFLFVEPGTAAVHFGNFEEKKSLGDHFTGSNQEYNEIRQLCKHLESENAVGFFTSGDNAAEKYKILHAYVTSHRYSYVSLWVLIHHFLTGGYKQEIDSILPLYAEDIRLSKPYKALVAKLIAQKSTALHRPFPFSVFPFGQRLANKVNKVQYTLVDFWASYCKPCIQELPALVRLYNEFGPKGFSIVSISIDNKENLAAMEVILKQHQVKWENLSDESGIASAKINVNGIPINFLIDTRGKIIAKNISAGDLYSLLKQLEYDK